jgi:hypothetical protein
LYLVTAAELADLRNGLARKKAPADLTAKLNGMVGENLTQLFIEQNCRLFIALLAAAQDGSFNEASATDCERLLRVLAYVRKDDDYIPDYRPGGFADDQQEIRAALNELSPVLRNYKAWRLRHQVPRLWLMPAAVPARLSNAA